MSTGIHRFLHTMIRVSDLDKAIKFYEMLGMSELRRKDFPKAKFTLVFMGYGEESNSCVIELTYNYEQTDYTHGTSFGHIALAVKGIYEVCEQLKEGGVTILRDPAPLKHSSSDGKEVVIAFLEDPDGFKIELIESE